MNQIDTKTAHNFVEDLIKDFWLVASKKYISRYCHPDLIGYHQGKTFTNADQMERMLNNLDAYKDRQVKDIEASVVDNKIICKYVLVGQDVRTKEDVAFPLSEIYVMDKTRVKEALVLSDLSFAYKYAGQKEVEKKNFQQLNQEVQITKLQDQLVKLYSNILSRRQIECLAYSAFGYTAKEIANELDLSFRTVESYMHSLKTKYACATKTQLLRKLQLANVIYI